jgi:hypothetical protein
MLYIEHLLRSVLGLKAIIKNTVLVKVEKGKRLYLYYVRI